MRLVRLLILTILVFLFQRVDAQYTQQGKTFEYHGRNSKTSYNSPVSISFQGCSPTSNDNKGNITLFFPTSKVGNVVSCTDIKISNPLYVVFNRNDFDIWTLGERSMPIVLCEKSKIDNYIAIYTKVQMEASEAKYKAMKKELQQSEEDNEELKKKIQLLESEHANEIKEIKSNALIFAYVDEEKLDSLQYEQHKCILNNDIERAVKIGQQIDFKNNINKQLSNFELSVKKSQEIGLKLFQEAEALYLHLCNCDMLSLENDSVKENYELLIKTYRALLDQYPVNFKCTESIYNKTKLKLGNIIYAYLDKFYLPCAEKDYRLVHDYMKESASYNNSKAIYWLADNGENHDEARYYAKLLFDGIKSGALNYPEEWMSYYDIKDICNSFHDFRIEMKSMVYYFTILENDEVSLVHAYCKDSTLTKIVIPQKVVYNNHEYIVTEIGACAFGSGSFADFNLGYKWRVEGESFNNWSILVKKAAFDKTIETNVRIIFPKKLKYVGCCAFYPRLQPVSFLINEIPKGLEILRYKSFYGCISKKNIMKNNKVTTIEDSSLPYYYDEKDEDIPYKCNYIITIPHTLKKLETFKGCIGEGSDHSRAKIVNINDNPNFRMIDGGLYNADSSYVYLGTLCQYNNRLNITRNLKLDDKIFERLFFTYMTDYIFIDSITIDERNPFYAYYNKCLYTKQLDTLLYILPSADKVRLSSNIKNIRCFDISIISPNSYFDLPDDINVYGMKAFIDLAISENMKFEYKGQKYNFNTNDYVDKSEDLILGFQRLNNLDAKALCAVGLIYLDKDKYIEAKNLASSILSVEGDSGMYYTILKDSCISYSSSMEELMNKLSKIDLGSYVDVVYIDKLRPYVESIADNSIDESAIYNAFYINWKWGLYHGLCRPYYDISRALKYMEYAEFYLKRILELYNTEENRKMCSYFYMTMAKIVWSEDQNKTFSYLQKVIELDPLKIEVYELLGKYYYENETNAIEREDLIREIISKRLTINPDYIPTNNSALKDIWYR